MLRPGVVRSHHRPGTDVSWSALLLALAFADRRRPRAGGGSGWIAAAAESLPRPPVSDGSRDPLAVASSLRRVRGVPGVGYDRGQCRRGHRTVRAAPTGRRAQACRGSVGARRRTGHRVVAPRSAAGSTAGGAVAAGPPLGVIGLGAGRRSLAELADQSRLDAGDAARAAAERASGADRRTAGTVAICLPSSAWASCRWSFGTGR